MGNGYVSPFKPGASRAACAARLPTRGPVHSSARQLPSRGPRAAPLEDAGWSRRYQGSEHKRLLPLCLSYAAWTRSRRWKWTNSYRVLSIPFLSPAESRYTYSTGKWFSCQLTVCKIHTYIFHGAFRLLTELTHREHVWERNCRRALLLPKYKPGEAPVAGAGRESLTALPEVWLQVSHQLFKLQMRHDFSGSSTLTGMGIIPGLSVKWRI